MKAQADSSSRGRKDFICREEKRKAAWRACRGTWETHGPMGQVGDWVFITFLYIAPGQGCLSGADRGFLGRRGVSLTTYHLLGPPTVCPSILIILISTLSMQCFTASNFKYF
jgi:hypothetical protein